MRLVLDTNVLVAALRSDTGASARVVEAVYEGRVVAMATVALFAEYEAVLTRPEHVAAAGSSIEAVVEALDDLAARVAPVEPHFSWRPQLADPDDEMVLEAAINGGAEAIITFEIGTFRQAAARFGVRGHWTLAGLISWKGGDVEFRQPGSRYGQPAHNVRLSHYVEWGPVAKVVGN